MDTPAIQQFNVELSSIYDSKVPLSKSKIMDITKAAMKGKAHYKHVVFSIEKFLQKCKTEHKIPVLYCIDSIIRTSKKQFKEKDVFGARFLAKFENIIKFLLQCSVAEQPRIVRTMNLWSANGVFKEDELLPFKQICRDHGLATDVEEVERLVKGQNADMAIYGGAYIKREKQSSSNKQPKFEARTPPLPSSSDANTSEGAAGLNDSFKEEQPSDDIPEGCISEKQLLNLMIAAGCDFGGCFSSDIGLLRKAHGEMCKTLILRQKDNLLAQKSGNIKNLLSSQFDYSDEEDSGDEGKKVPESVEPKPLSTEEVLVLADGLIRDPHVATALKAMQTERMMRLSQVAMMAQAQQRNMNIPVQPNMAVPPPNLPGMQPGMQQSLAHPQMPPTSLAGLPPGLQLPPSAIPGIPNGIPGLQLPLPGGLQVSAASSIQQAHNAALLGLLQQGGLANIGLLAQQAPGGIQFNATNRPGAPPVTQAPPGMDLLKQQELLKHLGVGPMSVPPPGMPGLMGAVPGQIPPNVLHQIQQQQQQIIQQQMENSAMAMEVEESNKAGRSRDRDRKDPDRKRNKSKERRDNKEKERERRKMGLPQVVLGQAIIATKTLWFGRLPPNCTDTDIKSALLGTGDVIRASVIPTKACAYVTMDSRRSASEVISRLASNLTIKEKQVKVDYAVGNGVKDEPFKSMWDKEKGITQIPWQMLPADLEALCVGAHLDTDSLPMDKQSLYRHDGTINVPVPEAMDNSMELSTPPGSPIPSHMQPNSGHYPMGGMAHSQFNRMPPSMPGQGVPPSMAGMNVPPPGMGGMQGQQHFGGRGGFQGGFRGRGGGFRGRGGYHQGGPPPPHGGYGGPPENGGGDRPPWRRDDRNGGERRGFNSEERRPYCGDRRDERRFDRDRPPRPEGREEGDRRPVDRGDERRDRNGDRNGRREGERTDRTERRRSRWGEEGDQEERRERRDRDEKDEERRDRRSPRERESRRDRTRSRSKSHDRDRKRNRRESPTYDEPIETVATTEEPSDSKVMEEKVGDIRAPGSADEATVTSTTQDVEMQQVTENEKQPSADIIEKIVEPEAPVECTKVDAEPVVSEAQPENQEQEV